MNSDKVIFLHYFTEVFNLKNFRNETKRFKLRKLSMIDLNLTNYRHSFMETAVLETGISDHNKIFFFVIKQTLTKALPRTICY